MVKSFFSFGAIVSDDGIIDGSGIIFVILRVSSIEQIYTLPQSKVGICFKKYTRTNNNKRPEKGFFCVHICKNHWTFTENGI